jgi:hypothetical protein
MSSGGEEGDSYGIAMWIYRGKLYSRVSTKKYEWTVYTKDFEVDEYFGCKMSWSKQYGLSFYKNKKHEKTSRKHKKRKGSKSRKDKFKAWSTPSKAIALSPLGTVMRTGLPIITIFILMLMDIRVLPVILTNP